MCWLKNGVSLVKTKVIDKRVKVNHWPPYKFRNSNLATQTRVLTGEKTFILTRTVEQIAWFFYRDVRKGQEPNGKDSEFQVMLINKICQRVFKYLKNHLKFWNNLVLIVAASIKSIRFFFLIASEYFDRVLEIMTCN